VCLETGSGPVALTDRDVAGRSELKPGQAHLLHATQRTELRVK
jgi:hypothetical protein